MVILHVVIFVADLLDKNIYEDYREVMAGVLKEIIVFATLNFSRMDIWDKKKRSAVMAKIRRKDENRPYWKWNIISVILIWKDLYPRSRKRMR